MSERPFMQLYVSDFIGDTLHLSTEQVGAYLLLLMAMWNAGGSLPDEESKLARVARMSVRKWRAVASDLMPFFCREEGTITHNRLTKELQKSESKSQSRASAGAKGGAAKALKDNKSCVANASDLSWHLPDTRYQKEKEPLAQQQEAKTALRGEGVLDKLCDAAGIRGNPPPGLAFIQPILGLMDAGYDLERDILPAIKAKPKPDVRQWSYFVPQIRDAAEARKSAASIPKPAEAQFDWTVPLKLYRQDGYWAAGWGPKPGEPGCRVPAALLDARAA